MTESHHKDMDPSPAPPDQQSYKYQSLDRTTREIRILELLPSSWDDDIRCNISTVSLDTGPSYEAISYAWGDPNDTRPIFLNSFKVSVTRNLESALRHLRKSDETLVLWNDALCIDQRNMDEKNFQVVLMREIYRACSRVIIWLGVPNTTPKESWWKYLGCLGRLMHPFMSSHDIRGSKGKLLGEPDDPFAIVNHFAEDKHIYELPCFSKSVFHKGRRFIESSEFNHSWACFTGALQSTWWTRLWCVQEALLPDNALVVFGQWRISWQKLKIAALNRHRHLLSCCLLDARKMPTRFGYFADSLIIDKPISTDDKDKNDPHYDLDWMLRRYRHRGCQNPQDKVYGIFGLIDAEKYATLNPDYSVGFQKVFTNAMEAIIMHKREDLRWLTGSGFNSSRLDLPSWVRDLAIPLTQEEAFQESQRLQAYSLYNACASTTCIARTLDHAKLFLTGSRVGRVHKVGKAIQRQDFVHIARVVASWYRLIGQTISTKVSFSANPILKAFWQTVIGDAFLDSDNVWKRLSDSDLQAYERWVSAVISAWIYMINPHVHELFAMAILAASFARAMFITTDGRIGLGNPNTQIGDEIWILNSGRVPFILRPNDKVADVGFLSRRIVGDAYLNDFMDGEAFQCLGYSVRELVLE